MRILFLCVGLLASGQAGAASLRTMTTLHNSNVYLRDLFDDAGRNADTLLGPGPAPGDRIIVGSAQLNAIARQFSVGWRSVSTTDQAVLEWPGRPMRREDVIEAVRTALTAAGAPEDWNIEIPNFAPPVVPFEGSSPPTVSQLDYDSNSGRFSAMLSITGEGMNPISTRISGQIEEMADLPVASTRLLIGNVLRAEDVHIARVRISLARNDVARTLEQIVGMELRRPVAADQPLRLTDLTRVPLVQRGATVQVQFESSGVSVTGQAVAIEAGVEGDKIRVQNQNSRALLIAEIIGPGRVRILPETLSAAPDATVRAAQTVR